MEEKLDEILFTLKNIDKRLENMEEHLKIVNKDCSKMSEHIQFVEKTYNAARTPLNYLKNKIEYMMGSTTNNGELPKLEYKEPERKEKE
jgi:archaellum component FlaC